VLAVLPLPKFQVLRSVVLPVAVDVMDGFGPQQRTAKPASHNQSVLKNVAGVECH